MWKKYEMWILGLKTLAMVLMSVALAPVAIALFLTLAIQLIDIIFEIDFLTLEKHYNDIFFVCFIIFGPYYLTKMWPSIIETHQKMKEEL